LNEYPTADESEKKSLLLYLLFLIRRMNLLPKEKKKFVSDLLGVE